MAAAEVGPPAPSTMTTPSQDINIMLSTFAVLFSSAPSADAAQGVTCTGFSIAARCLPCPRAGMPTAVDLHDRVLGSRRIVHAREQGGVSLGQRMPQHGGGAAVRSAGPDIARRSQQQGVVVPCTAQSASCQTAGASMGVGMQISSWARFNDQLVGPTGRCQPQSAAGGGCKAQGNSKVRPGGMCQHGGTGAGQGRS